MLADAMDVNGNTPLINAVRKPSKQQKETVEFLLANGANPNAQGLNATTPILSAMVDASMDIVRMLLAAGADINAMDNNGQTALGIAAVTGRKKLVDFVLENGFETDAQTLTNLLEESPKVVRGTINEWLDGRREVCSRYTRNYPN